MKWSRLLPLACIATVIASAVACGTESDGSAASGGATSGAGGKGGAGGTNAGTGGTHEGGSGGAVAGAGGQGGESCPTDYFAADGQPCSEEGKVCSDGSNDPCDFGNSIECVNGEWLWQESFPAPCGGAGGQGGNGGQGGDGGAASGAGGAQGGSGGA